MNELHCPACDQSAIAEVASGDARVNTIDGYSVCDIRPHEHSGTGFRHFVHKE